MRTKFRNSSAVCGLLLLLGGCSSPDVPLGYLGVNGVHVGNASGGQRATTNGSATSTGGSVSSMRGSGDSSSGDAALAPTMVPAEAGILGSCPNPVEIDVSSGEGWADLRWTNALPAFIRPGCAVEDIPIYSGAPGMPPHTVWRALVVRFVMPYDGWMHYNVWSEAFDAVTTDQDCAPCVLSTCRNATNGGGGCGVVTRMGPLPSVPWAAGTIPESGGGGYYHAGDVRFVWVQPVDANNAPAENRIVVNVTVSR